MSTLMDDTILVGTSHCVLREQEDQYVVYNSHTDELHLIPALGHYLYRLCDGLRDVGSIWRAFAIAAPEDAEVRTRITAYLEKLVARGILQGDHHA
jgi:hypothetical protein